MANQISKLKRVLSSDTLAVPGDVEAGDIVVRQTAGTVLIVGQNVAGVKTSFSLTGAAGAPGAPGPIGPGGPNSQFPFQISGGGLLGQFVEPDAGNPTFVAACGATPGGGAVGVLLATKGPGQPCDVIYGGLCNVLAGAAIAINQAFSYDATGRAVPATNVTLGVSPALTGSITHGIAMSAAGGAGVVFQAVLTPNGSRPGTLV